MSVDTTNLTFYIAIGGQVLSGDGVVLDADGVGVTFTKLTGWWEPPASTGAVSPRSGRHGAFVNEAFVAERNIVIDGEVFAPNRVALINGIESLLAAIPVNTLTPLVVYEDGLGKRHAMVRQGGQHIVDWEGKASETGDGLTAVFSIQLVAPDPRRLSGDGIAPDKVIRGTPSIPETVVANGGKGLMPPAVIRISDVGDPMVVVNDQMLSFDVSLTGTQELEIDFDKKSVKVSGVNKRSIMTGRWPVLNDDRNTFNVDAMNYGTSPQMALHTYDSFK